MPEAQCKHQFMKADTLVVYHQRRLSLANSELLTRTRHQTLKKKTRRVNGSCGYQSRSLEHEQMEARLCLTVLMPFILGIISANNAYILQILINYTSSSNDLSPSHCQGFRGSQRWYTKPIAFGFALRIMLVNFNPDRNI